MLNRGDKYEASEATVIAFRNALEGARFTKRLAEAEIERSQRALADNLRVRDTADQHVKDLLADMERLGISGGCDTDGAGPFAPPPPVPPMPGGSLLRPATKPPGFA